MTAVANVHCCSVQISLLSPTANILLINIFSALSITCDYYLCWLSDNYEGCGTGAVLDCKVTWRLHIAVLLRPILTCAAEPSITELPSTWGWREDLQFMVSRSISLKIRGCKSIYGVDVTLFQNLPHSDVVAAKIFDHQWEIEERYGMDQLT